MAEQTKIEWCDHTFNPWIGCAKVGAGCTHCYAETLMDTRVGRVQWGEHGTRERTSHANWQKVRSWNKHASARLGRKARVFCASLADVAEDRQELVPWRLDLIDLIRECTNLDFLLLTKRPQNLRRMFPTDVLERCWVGASVATQKDADANLPELLQTPAAIRFVSLEPQVECVDIPGLNATTSWCPICKAIVSDSLVDMHRHSGVDLMAEFDVTKHCVGVNAMLHWIIQGGESGKGARPFDIAWAREVRDQCKAAGVPYFLKQLGSNAVFTPEDEGGTGGQLMLKHPKGGDPSEWPPDLQFHCREFPEVQA